VTFSRGAFGEAFFGGCQFYFGAVELRPIIQFNEVKILVPAQPRSRQR
jgi:hypothetical protein